MEEQDNKVHWKKREYYKSGSGQEYRYGILQTKDESSDKVEEPIEEEIKQEVKQESPKVEEKQEPKVDINAIVEKAVAEALAKQPKQQPSQSTDFSVDIANAIVKAKDLREGRPTYSTSKELDVNDWDEKGVEFIVYKTSYVITDDKRNGRSIIAPYGAIKFKLKSAKLIKNGRDSDYKPICGYKSNSKKEIEFIRAFSKYNTLVFEKVQATEQDLETLSFIATHNIGKMLDAKDSNGLLQLAKFHGIDQGNSIDVIKAKLHVKLSKEEIAKLKKVEANKKALEQEHKIFQD